MTLGRIVEFLGDLLRKKVRFIVHIYGGGGRINKIEMTNEVDLK